ncbi:hypothetical protein ACIQZG_23225 [Lysinibacillus sp. NPDC096418]|uniref:hypothetical protein n=1 Tax=Lysinibacillus sp. NPDC096418 TaxID=3364138 RepID=UPI00382471CC
MNDGINATSGFIPNLQVAPKIIQTKFGDINGDGFFDTILLTGVQKPDSPLWQHLTLIVFYGRTQQFEQIILKENVGYNPTIFLGDFTSNHIEDILVVSDTGGSGGIINAEIYSFIDGKMRQIFDAESFSNQLKFTVNFQDHYQATVQSSTPPKRYTLNLLYKGKEYLAEIYNPNGTLKEPIEGWVDPISGLYPIDFDRDGIYELLAMQKISGRYHADGLGFVENVLAWDGHRFTIDRQNVSIEGEDLTQ